MSNLSLCVLNKKAVFSSNFFFSYFLYFYVTDACNFTFFLICIFLKYNKNLEIKKTFSQGFHSLNETSLLSSAIKFSRFEKSTSFIPFSDNFWILL